MAYTPTTPPAATAGAQYYLSWTPDNGVEVNMYHVRDNNWTDVKPKLYEVTGGGDAAPQHITWGVEGTIKFTLLDDIENFALANTYWGTLKMYRRVDDVLVNQAHGLWISSLDGNMAHSDVRTYPVEIHVDTVPVSFWDGYVA